MSDPTPADDGPVAAARATLDEHDTVAFDRLVHAVLATPHAPLGALLRAQLPGTTGVRWLRHENLSPTARSGQLTSDQWLSLFASWNSAQRAPGRSGPGGQGKGGRPSTHGHGPGAMAAPRWGQ